MTDPIDPNEMRQPAEPAYRRPSPFARPEERAAALEYGPPPGSYGMPYPYPYPPPDPPVGKVPKRKLLIVIAAAGAAVVIAIGVTLFLVFRDDGTATPKPLVLPDRFGAYTALHNATADQVRGSISGFISGSGSAGKQLNKSAAIGAYGTADLPRLVVIVLPSSAFPGRTSNADRNYELAGNLGAVATVSSFPPGSLGGVLSCGTVQFGKITEALCAWSDAKTAGVLVSVQPALALPQNASVTNQLRAAVE